MTAYVSGRDGRWWYAADAIEAIEDRNCSLGCRRGARDAVEAREVGPGGSCDVLCRVSIGGGDVIPELDDDGTNVTCTVREPL